jgi:tetratricopeptide (TPR) repeat protein
MCYFKCFKSHQLNQRVDEERKIQKQPDMKKLSEQGILLTEIKNHFLGNETLISKQELVKHFKSTYRFELPIMEIDFEFFYYGVLGCLTGKPLEETKRNAAKLSGWHLEDTRKLSYSFPQFGIGMNYLDKKNYEKAIETFQLGLQIYPRQFVIWQNLIKAYQLSGKSKKAKKTKKRFKSILSELKQEIAQKSSADWIIRESKRLFREVQNSIRIKYNKYNKMFPEVEGILGQLYKLIQEIGKKFEGKKSKFTKLNVIQTIEDILEGYLVWIAIIASLTSEILSVSEHSIKPNEKIAEAITETLGWTPKALNKSHFLNSQNYYNPELRKKAWIKLLGTDPLSLTPLNSIREAFYHRIDNTDNPESHMWVSGQMEEMKLSKEMSEDHSSHLHSNFRLIEEHIERYIGKIGNVLHDRSDFEVHIDIFIVPPTKERNNYLLITSGMSEKPMHAPPDSWKWWGLDFERMNVAEKDRAIFELRFAELMIKLPPDWPMPEGKIEKNNYSWPFEELLHLIEYVHKNKEWFWVNHTMRGQRNDAFSENTELTGWLFTFSMGDIPQEFNTLKINKHKAIYFLQLVPLYYEEIQYAMDHGTEALINIFREYRMPDYVDIKRKNVCK